MIESWVEMARRTQKMSFICNLGKGIGLRRERSDMLRDGGERDSRSPTDEFTLL